MISSKLHQKSRLKPEYQWIFKVIIGRDFYWVPTVAKSDLDNLSLRLGLYGMS